MNKGCKIIDPLSISRIFTFFKKKFDPGYFFKGESHDFYEVVCVLSGRVGITAGKSIYVLENIDNTAILIECGFLTNPEECEKLSQKEYQKELSFSIICGIINYKNNIA